MSDTDNRTLLLDLCPEPRLPQTAYLRRAFAADRRLNVYQVKDLRQAIPVIQKASTILIYFEVSKKEHVVSLIILLSAVARLIQKGVCKSIGFNLIAKGAEQIETMLKQKGVSEVATIRTSEKGILHKVNRFLESMNAIAGRGRPSSAGQGGESKTAHSLEWIDALKIPNDYWVLQKLNDVKIRREVWMFNLIGPPPSFGKWELDRSLKSNGLDAWIWVPRKQPAQAGAEESAPGGHLRSVLEKGDGKWIFWGNPPQFSTQSFLWLFVSKSPRFAFYSRANPKEPFVKIGIGDGKLKFAKNSPSAGKFVSEVQACLSVEVRFKSGGAKGKELALNVDRGRKKPGAGLDLNLEKDANDIPLVEFKCESQEGNSISISEDELPSDIGFDPGQGASLDYSKDAAADGDGGTPGFSSADEPLIGEADIEPSVGEVDPEVSGPEPDLNFGQDERDFDWKKSQAGADGTPALDGGAPGEFDPGFESGENPGFFQTQPDSDDAAFTFGNGKKKAKVVRLPGQAEAEEKDARGKPGARNPEDPNPKVPEFGAPGASTAVGVGVGEEKPEAYDKLFQDLAFSIVVIPQLMVAGEQKSFPAKFLDLFENQLSLELGMGVLRRAQIVKVEFKVAGAQPPLEFSTRAKVMEIESMDGSSMIIGFEIEPVDPKLLGRFISIFQERQGFVNDFLIAAKGGR